MKILQITIIVVLTISTILTTGVFAQNTGSVALVFLRPDKEIYFPGDSVFIHGQDNMNVTSITIGLEKNHNVMVSSEDSPVLKNGTFYANFTLPRDSDAKYWSLVSGPLHQDLYFKPVYLSPLKQFKSGISANNVKCEQGLQLVIKAKDDSPACVKQDAVQKLIERGWGNMLTPTAWFRYTTLDPFEFGSDVHKDVPWSNYIPANMSETAYKPWFNGTAIKEYFTNHGVTVLEVRYSSYLLAGPEGVGTTPQLQTDFYFLTLHNDTDQMDQFGFKMINVDPRQNLSLFGQILPLNN